MSNDKILIVDDERKMCIVLKAAFEHIGLSVTTADSGEAERPRPRAPCPTSGP